MTKPGDSKQRALALDLTRSFIVQAPAGSGKTELLTQRFLKLLAGVDRPERILAITFTRKATREMRDRIMRRLVQAAQEAAKGAAAGATDGGANGLANGTASGGAASDGTTGLDHERVAVELAKAVLQRDAELGWNLLKNPGRLCIFTIDGLCTQLLARDPEQGSHLAGRALPEDPKPLYRQAVQRMFEDLGHKEPGQQDAAPGKLPSKPPTQSPAQPRGQPKDQGESGARAALVRVLVHLDGNSQALQDLLVSMMQIRDQWTRRIGTDEFHMAELLHDRQHQELKQYTEALGEQALLQAMAIVAELGAAMDDRSSIPALFAIDIAEAHCDPDHGGEVAQESAGEIADEIRQAHLFSSLFLTASGGPRQPGGITRSLFKGLPAGLSGRIADLKAIYGQWHQNDAAILAIQRMARTPPIDLGFKDPELNELRPATSVLRDDIREILKHTLAQLTVLFAEQGVADFQFVTEAALQSLGDDERPGQVLLDEDQRVEHILMDEFQDTSNTQFELLSRMVSGWGGDNSADGARSLFLVGDPMQSIYRFREANVGLFIDVVQSGRVASVPLHYLKLESNFRSNDEIVNWVNQQFGCIFPKENLRDSGAVSYAAAHAESGPGGQVTLHPLAPESTGRDEAELALQLIAEAREQLDDPSIAVLVRARSHLLALAQALVSAGIEFEAVKVDPLAERPVVGDLLAITRALSHPADRIAWLALLRAPWCGLDTRQLHHVAGDDDRADLFERMGLVLDGAAGERASDEASDCAGEVKVVQSLRKLRDVLQQAIDARGSHTLRERVEYCWLHLGGPYCYATHAELENADAFLELLDSLEQDSSEDLITRLEEGLQDLYARSSPSRLQLMTIHQAKGLEFDVVILPGLHRTPRRGDKPLVALQEFRTLDGHDAALMAGLPARGHDAPSVYGYLNAVNEERSAFETQRLLYVAATRAKHRLHMLGRYQRSKKDGTASAPRGTFMHMLWPAFLGHIDDSFEGAEAEREPKQAPMPLPLLRLVNPPPLPTALTAATGLEPNSKPAQLRPLPAQEAAALGDALHHWLELIHDHWKHGWTAQWFEQHPEALASTLKRGGVKEGRIADLLPSLTAMLVNAISTEASRALLSPEGKSGSWSELTLYKRESTGISRHIIDRMYQEADGKLVIVDYKSGEDSTTTRQLWKEQLARYRTLVNDLDLGQVSGTLIHQASDNTVIDLSRETGLPG